MMLLCDIRQKKKNNNIYKSYCFKMCQILIAERYIIQCYTILVGIFIDLYYINLI